MMSQTKTFTGTAIAIAEAEGLLGLDERLVDIFPEYVPENPSENLQKMTIRHLLRMGGGMEATCRMDEHWLENFFATPVPNEPGTAFFYNDSAVTVLPAIIRKKTGLHIVDFLRPRLFDKIGIDADNITWFNVADGTAFGAGGLHCTTEDALRLMKLYADGGVWDGEQLIPADYLPKEHRKALGILGSRSGRDGDKIADSGLTSVFAEGTTYFAEADLVFICRKLYQAPLVESGFVDKGLVEFNYHGKYHEMYVGEIVKVLA